FLEKQRWGSQNEVPQDDIYESETTTTCYRWVPVLCDEQGRIASDASIYSTDLDVVDVKDVDEALRAGKIHYLYRRMWYDVFKYMGCDTKLYTKDEVVAIEKDNFRWPDTW
ncbi:MAG TPA: hypothetical protein VIQ97_04880, partial [Prevotella sp.]